ncbi:PP2C family protein-serine/threonine phosphatase [Embleya sp. NBC_00896]|uniref:PP2C family protein-serine/threonine phosphatase n=1 Tax=Embleya sp. NBC_00896 TaxID=2975961 RepID=UPI00386FEA77|nr:SpoIIE family protein phosphatase [Embleya sp. NBC_00896]
MEARYQPSTDVPRIGGDWYDLIRLPDHVPCLMVGDVMGHGIEAATAMSQISNILRVVAFDGKEPPSRILHRLDVVLHALHGGPMATVVAARITADDRCETVSSLIGVVGRPQDRVGLRPNTASRACVLATVVPQDLVGAAGEPRRTGRTAHIGKAGWSPRPGRAPLLGDSALHEDQSRGRGAVRTARVLRKSVGNSRIIKEVRWRSTYSRRPGGSGRSSCTDRTWS